MIENQYIELFERNKELIDKSSVEQMNALRLDALAQFKRLGFPTKQLEDYQSSDIAAQFNFQFNFTFENKEATIDAITNYTPSIKDITNNIYYIINDTILHNQSPINYPSGVFVGSLKEFATQHADIVKKHYGTLANMSNNAIVAFNTMFAKDAFVIYVPNNVVVEDPIQIINLMTGSCNTIANRRLLIVAGKNSQVKILANDQTIEKEHKFISTLVTEIWADENAHIDLYELDENSDNTSKLASTTVNQKENASVLINNIAITSGFTRNNYNVKLNGENSETTVAGLVVEDKKQHVDNFVFIDHLKPHCTSTQLFKYVLQEQSSGAFCGRIRVEKDAQKTMAYQTNNNLCTSPESKMNAKPQLEIYADDVKCSHGLTTGQLDEEALFYLRARGIPMQQAKLILMQAFTAQVLQLIRLKGLKEQLEHIIEIRFRGKNYN